MDVSDLTPYERQNYLQRMEELRNQNVISEKALLELVGYTDTGEFVLAPNSFSRGYQHAFIPPTQRPHLTTNIVGLFGKLSDDSWIFIPSYNQGMAYGHAKINNLKFAVLAEGQRRLWQESEARKQREQELERRLAQVQEKLSKFEEDAKKNNRNENQPKK